MTDKKSSDDKAPVDAPVVEATVEPLSADDRKALNIYQKIAAITGEVGIIAKGGRNTEQNYSFIEYAAVAGRLRELFAKYYVVIVPNMAKTADQKREEIVSQYGKKGVVIMVDFKFDIVNADKPDDRFSVDWVGEAADFGDKATNKAATSALKYYLMRQFNISEKGEAEADAESPDRGQVDKGNQRQNYQPKQSAPAKPSLPARPANAAMDDQERAALFAAMLKVGIDTKEEQLELLRVNGITDPKTLTSGMAKTMINKLQNKTFARPNMQDQDQPSGGTDVVIEDIDDGPINLNDIPDDFGKSEEPEPETPPQEQRVMTEEVIAEINDRLQSIGLSTWGLNHFLKDTVGTPFLKNLKPEDWRKLDNRINAVLNQEETIPDNWIAGVEPMTEEEQAAADQLALDQAEAPHIGEPETVNPFTHESMDDRETVDEDDAAEEESAPEEAKPVIDNAFKDQISEDMKEKGITGAERLRMLRQVGVISFKQMTDDAQWLELRKLVDIHEGNKEDAK